MKRKVIIKNRHLHDEIFQLKREEKKGPKEPFHSPMMMYLKNTTVLLTRVGYDDEMTVEMTRVEWKMRAIK